MAYTVHQRLTFGGHFQGRSGPIEQWQTGLSLYQTPTATGAPTDDDLASMREAVQQFWANPGSHMPNNVFLDFIKVARIGPDGKYTDDPKAVYDLNLAGGANGASLMPPQVALVISLMTPVRGAKGRGRCYLPAPNGVLDDWRLENGFAGEIATSFATLIEDLARTNGDNAFPVGSLKTACVASRSGSLAPVTAIRVGHVLDTVRSRRRSIPENYLGPVSATTTVISASDR